MKLRYEDYMKDIDLSSMINLTKQVFTLIEQEYQVFLSSAAFH